MTQESSSKILLNNQKQDLYNKMKSLLSNVKLDGDIVTFGNNSFRLPSTTSTTTINSTKTTSR